MRVMPGFVFISHPFITISILLGLLNFALVAAAQPALPVADPDPPSPLDWRQQVILEQPFWATGTMVNESVLMISSRGGAPEAPLLIDPIKILSVKNSHLDVEYTEGLDWYFKDGKLRLTSNTHAAFMTSETLNLPPGKGMPKRDGGGVFFMEGHYFHDLQLAVTYTHAPGAWHGPATVFDSTVLTRTQARLRARQPLKIVFFGDSITLSLNASGTVGAPPYLPGWTELFVKRLGAKYHSQISFQNCSATGASSDWGRENVPNLAQYPPDLLVVGFGMNDIYTDPDAYAYNMKVIVMTVFRANPNCEFILLAPMLPNPETFQFGNQGSFGAMLKPLNGHQVTVVDMGAVHRVLLKRKRYADLTGNNVNHPNDFMLRWYYHMVSALLVPSPPDAAPPLEQTPAAAPPPTPAPNPGWTNQVR